MWGGGGRQERKCCCESAVAKGVVSFFGHMRCAEGGDARLMDSGVGFVANSMNYPDHPDQRISGGRARILCDRKMWHRVGFNALLAAR